MELANNYITDDNLNRDEIKEILNSKKENKEKLKINKIINKYNK